MSLFLSSHGLPVALYLDVVYHELAPIHTGISTSIAIVQVLFRQLSNWDFYKCIECIIIEISWEQLPCHTEKTQLLVLWLLTIPPHLPKCYLDDGISLCQPDQLGAHCVDQTGFELTKNHLVLKGIKGMCYYSCFNLTFKWSIPLLGHPPPTSRWTILWPFPLY